MKKVLQRILENGFDEVTIGVEQTIKTKVVDQHGFDLQGNPKKVPPYDLYLKSFS